ncbi:hypothetical protein [Clostridium isatidis]|uniref:Uncharacterized protein n=1 Tax=Clostridium isatidis TaxID=182773 RepID=A0A343JAI4_9CLOT|nr:hypothetical protein [Clostridium isatidis]ASW42542.1 hypothetical protein BEN51_03330 [Clostridium isatidis]NLZ33747.1 hypothetical protein [Clostridiales bacterium]
MNGETLESIKRKIQENINYAKENNLKKVSAIMIFQQENTKMEVLSWLIMEGYKVSLKREEADILTIEW